MASVEFFSKKSDGTVAKKIASGHVGEIIFFPIDTPPEHTLICNGAELSVSAYPELFAVLGTKYGGNGTTTFKLPVAEDVIYAAGVNHTVGETVTEGLPNISAGCSPWVGTIPPTSGSFFTMSSSEKLTISAGGSYSVFRGSGNLNAANANAIYGSSAHVTPAGIALLACIVYE
ncbi:phage tail protein [Cloacibacillus evryensis]|uniref:phage tail protein n=1 Tax=Cloacibacillus evryensis TaxID=508460 RepID=UPI00241DF57D|nr:phage tail protein [Cloacibacillus evryensis]